MEQEYLIESNIVIYYLEGLLNPQGLVFLNMVLREKPRISIISKIELLGWNAPKGTDIQKIQTFIHNSFLYRIPDEIVDKAKEIRKRKTVKIADAIIAATSLIFHHTLITRNEYDFTNIPVLTIVNPFKL